MASGEGNSTKLPSEEKESEKDPVIKDATAANANTANLDVDDDKGDDLVIDEQNDAEKSDEGESDEKEFEPTLDMMMNDFDDEQTMEEEGEFQFISCIFTLFIRRKNMKIECKCRCLYS